MTAFAIIGWLLAAGLGIGWWLDHRGIAGIKSDLADAMSVVQRLIARMK
ncbi:MAG TPA: hypothetical protein VIH40_01180 [Xanthobacteraceae bacterium]